MSNVIEMKERRVLVVDDTPSNLELVSSLLRDSYNVLVANSGTRALELLERGSIPDLILLDVMMPGMSGFDVMEQLRNHETWRDIPVIFVTAMNEIEDETRGLDLGAVDYIMKPITPAVLAARVATQLELKSARDALKYRAEFLDREVARRTHEVETIQDVTVLAMASLAESRDHETGNHILRTQYYVKALAEKLAENPKFQTFLDDKNIRKLFKSAPLHDIGKVGIPDNILLKAGKLTTEEFEIMKTHTTIGYESIVRAESALGQSLDFLQFAKEIALYHQEKWDGSGYPEGLSGDAIPLSARLMALADVYVALISKRVYKPAFSHEKAVAIILAGAGSHFDPDVVDAFESITEQFVEIKSRYSDD